MENKDLLDYPIGTFRSPVSCEVEKVLIRDGMHVEKGQTMFIMRTPTPSSYVPMPLSDESQKSRYKKSLDGLSNLPVSSSVDNQLTTNAAEADAKDIGCSSKFSRRRERVMNHDAVMNRYKTFKKFDSVVDHSDHLFSAHTCVMKHPDCSNTVKKEWRILEQHLPENIFVRVYKSRMDLLRAVIVGRAGTPYHNGLFFFDLFLPNKYPYIPPLVRYHSGGLGINPNLNTCGEVCLKLLNTSPTKEKLWVPGMNIRSLLVAIQDLIFNTQPYYNWLQNTSVRGSVSGEYLSFLYNENTVVKSLKTMAYTMNKPLKNFEDFVAGHFRTHARDILVACKAYMEGLQIRCLVSDVNVTCSIEFKNDVASCIKPLKEAFKKIGAKEAKKLPFLVNKMQAVIVQDINDAANKKRKVVVDQDINVVTNKKDAEVSHGSDHTYVSWNFSASCACLVTKVLVKDGMKVEIGQPLYVENVNYIRENGHITSTARQPESARQKINHGSHVNTNEVLERYKNFKKFDSVVDHSNHFFSARNYSMYQPPKDWVNAIKEEWRILEEQLPETIFVRVYQSRKDLLRAVIIGPKGTPYHGSLFFFDVCFPRNYPDSPPFVHYHSGGLGINHNMPKCGKVSLSLPKKSGGLEPMWVPGNTNILQLLVSIQKKFLNSNPIFNEPTYAVMRGSPNGEQASFTYNEKILIKSLKTMLYILNKPPKNFEDFVVGYFRNRASDIILACSKKGCSAAFIEDLVSCVKFVTSAFKQTGALDRRVVMIGLKKHEVHLELKNYVVYK